MEAVDKSAGGAALMETKGKAGAEDVSLLTEETASMCTAQVSEMTVPDLKRALKSRALSIDGKKGVLAERLLLAMVNESSVNVDDSRTEGSALVEADPSTAVVLAFRCVGVGRTLSPLLAARIVKLQTLYDELRTEIPDTVASFDPSDDNLWLPRWGPVQLNLLNILSRLDDEEVLRIMLPAPFHMHASIDPGSVAFNCYNQLDLLESVHSPEYSARVTSPAALVTLWTFMPAVRHQLWQFSVLTLHNNFVMLRH